MFALSGMDAVALGWFLLAWVGYSLLIDQFSHGRSTVTGLMVNYRKAWMREMAARDVRIVDTQINQHLQQGAAFFASTSLLALGGALTLLASSEKAFALLQALPLDYRPSRALWDVKCAGLAFIFIYAFFKFGWAYRLFNYCAILIGATPSVAEGQPPSEEALKMARRAADMNRLAAQQFNRGQRAFFFSLAFLGWFVSAYLLLITTSCVLIVLHRRQFWSEPLKVLQ